MAIQNLTRRNEYIRDLLFNIENERDLYPIRKEIPLTVEDPRMKRLRALKPPPLTIVSSPNVTPFRGDSIKIVSPTRMSPFREGMIKSPSMPNLPKLAVRRLEYPDPVQLEQTLNDAMKSIKFSLAELNDFVIPKSSHIRETIYNQILLFIPMRM